MAEGSKRKKLEKTLPPADPIPPGNKIFYCCRCGNASSRQKGYFPVSHSPMYRGTGYLPWCAECIDKMYDEYRRQLGDDRAAMRRMCMKMDLYWHDSIYDSAERTAGVNSRIRSYITKTNAVRYVDKTFDDTLAEDGSFVINQRDEEPEIQEGYIRDKGDSEEEVVVPDDVALFWGPGYTPKMYLELEERRRFWMSKFPEGYEADIGEEALIRQICNLEIDINHDRAAGKPIDKGVNALNTLLGSLNVKPAQKKDSDNALAEIPFGVGIGWCEKHKPIAEPEEEFRDVDGVRRYVSIWLYGHLAKMMRKKNLYSKLYEDEIAKMRIEKPEFFDEDDEEFLNNVLADGGDEEWR